METVERPVLILGAGINGAALARELLLNRVPVCLVDTADLCSGATAASSRLIHGGLRYLEYGEFDLVRESLAERTRLLQLAPQFVRPLRLFIPVASRAGGLWTSASRFLGWAPAAGTSSDPRGLWLVSVGLWMYEQFARESTLPRGGVHGLCDPGVPPVDAGRYRWLCSYYDAQIVRPERFVVALLEDARRLSAEYGVPFQIFTYHRALLADGRIEVRAIPRSTLNPAVSPGGSERNEVAASFVPAAIVNATGAWVDHTLAQLHIPSLRLMGGTKGSHVITSHPRLRSQLGTSGIYVEADDGRPVFILPLGELTLVGTTDVPFQNGPENAVASDDEIEYLLHAVNQTIPDVGLTRDQIDLYYSGVRPLPYTDSQSPAAITRRHWLEEHKGSPVPLFSVIGGKLTTCRSLAEIGARTVLARLGREPTVNSQERVIPGGESYPLSESGVTQEQERLARQLGFGIEQIATVWELCGTRIETALTLSAEPERTDPRENLPGTSLPCRFVRWVIRNEWVQRLEDLVERRLMLLYHPGLSDACLRRLARLLSEERRLPEADQESAVAACRERLQKHYGKRVEE